MSDHVRWFIGIDWASEQHRVCLLDAEGKCVAERDVMHSGAELSEMCTWLLEKTAAEPAEIAIAIETPRGPVVEALLERGFKVFAVNPKQLDRFRDRFSVAGAKDDSRDAQVLAGSLRTDRQASRRLSVDDPLVIELREWSRIYDELKQEQNRLTNRMRGQLWRYFPAFLELEADLAAPWAIELWQAMPTPQAAKRVRKSSIETIL
ncbi:MAG: IS110 family transposase, partial [Xanthobacteraceae bacterium]